MTRFCPRELDAQDVGVTGVYPLLDIAQDASVNHCGPPWERDLSPACPCGYQRWCREKDGRDYSRWGCRTYGTPLAHRGSAPYLA